MKYNNVKIQKRIGGKVQMQRNGVSKISQNKGITLIALVITIVVLVILATVSFWKVLRRKWFD